MQIRLVAQTQYDYYDDHVLTSRADRTLNEIIIIVGFLIFAFILLLFIGGILNIYYWFNPQANPEYKKMMAKEKQEKYVQEQERKHEEYIEEQRKKAIYGYVDLGLSVKWATFNLGAYKPSDVGRTFCWAENQTIENHHEYGKTDINIVRDISGDIRYDAATKIIGGNWRLPTIEECQELLDLCKWETKIVDGIEGRLITGPNGNNIFLPFNQKSLRTNKYVAGQYWTASFRFKSNRPYNLRFGENCKQPAEIWNATANSSLCIRPVFTTITKEMAHKQKQLATKNAYDKISLCLSSAADTDIFTYYQEQCNICNEETNTNISPLYGGFCFIEEKVRRDEYDVVYSLDGKRLLDGRNCNCKIYKIKEGTEFICNNAFAISLGEKIFNKRKRILEKIILPSSLLYFPKSAVPENCSMESISPNYSVINNLLIDTRKKSVVKCLNKNVQQVEIYEPIESIDDEAFINCVELLEVVLPNSIKKLGIVLFAIAKC